MKRLSALALVFLLLTACGGQPAPTPTPTQAPTPTVSPSPLPTTEPGTEEGLFLAFLRGEAEATIGDDLYRTAEMAEESPLDGTRISKDQLEEAAVAAWFGEDADFSCRYTLGETLEGRKMLVVECAGKDALDGYTVRYILGAFGEEVRLVYAAQSWSRNWTGLHEGLILKGNASGGAGAGYEWYGFIDETGHYREVYSLQELGGPWITTAIDDGVFGQDTQWANNCSCQVLETAAGKCYALDTGAGADVDYVARYRDAMTAAQITEVEDVSAVLREALEDLELPRVPLDYRGEWVWLK